MGAIHIGTAGWTIPREVGESFPAEGTGLERYAARFSAAEINSSFHRPHRLSTWQRWHDSVPEDFRFAVKLPKTITHQRKLADCDGLLDEFVLQARELRGKLAVLLVQLPPKLAFDEDVARAFFQSLKVRSAATIVCEPRNATWFGEDEEAFLTDLEVARVAADPAPCEAAAIPGGWRGLSYWRLHGSPRMYRSSYADRIGDYSEQLREDAAGRDVWCIFDNTASSAAASDALALGEALAQAHNP